MKNFILEDFSKEDNKNTKEAIAIRDLLNYYEIIGVGVESDIYDIDMIRDAQKTMIVKIYEAAKPFIERSKLEDNNQELWVKFKGLVDILKGGQ